MAKIDRFTEKLLCVDKEEFHVVSPQHLGEDFALDHWVIIESTTERTCEDWDNGKSSPQNDQIQQHESATLENTFRGAGYQSCMGETAFYGSQWLEETKQRKRRVRKNKDTPIEEKNIKMATDYDFYLCNFGKDPSLGKWLLLDSIIRKTIGTKNGKNTTRKEHNRKSNSMTLGEVLACAYPSGMAGLAFHGGPLLEKWWQERKLRKAQERRDNIGAVLMDEIPKRAANSTLYLSDIKGVAYPGAASAEQTSFSKWWEARKLRKAKEREYQKNALVRRKSKPASKKKSYSFNLGGRMANVGAMLVFADALLNRWWEERKEKKARKRAQKK